jgi:transposase-like protein
MLKYLVWRSKKCQRCGSIREVKNRFNRGKKRFICEDFAFNYTGTKNGCPDSVKCKVLRYYSLGIFFIRFQRFLRISNFLVINLVKKSAKQ